ncbi:MAG: ABC transporter ATP-binding protein [Candidatus Aminicenantes bacterium]|nr:ABC transporter ATP-binding protein [Candidatus Aminicenantes bacterium]
MIEVNNLSYRFPDGTQALHQVSLRVREKERVAVIGPNGAGKSTLLLLLDGLLAGEGRIKILGTEVGRGNLTHIRSKVGLVFQDPDDQLFMPSVLDDVIYGLCAKIKSPDPEAIEKAREILRQLNAEALLNRSTMSLSLGEKKKVALAGVLIMEPEVLLLDEPTSGLDPAARRWLISYLSGLNRTMIFTTHNLELASRLAHRVILLNAGRVVADGPAAEILSDEKLLLDNGL